MSQTKSQLIQYFSGLDVTTLQKLQKYSSLLIIPEEDLLTNVNMSQMVDKAHSLADSLFPEWTDRSKSDFGEFLVELFAVFSEKDFWYINSLANEGLLRKMRSYSNAFSRSIEMGYSPITCKGASGLFDVTFSGGEATTYDRGDIIVQVGDKKFINDSPFSVEESAPPITKQLTLNEGTFTIEDVTYNGYCIFIRKSNIDVDSISVIIDNITYTQVRNFGFSSAGSNHFLVLPEEDGSASIYFGSNGYGVSPSIGKGIRVEYRKCTGSDGNKAIQDSSVIDSLPDRPATTVAMISITSGGSYADTLTAIKEKAPMYFNNKGAAINEAISQEIINSFPSVHKSSVTVIDKTVSYQVIPSSGTFELTSDEVSALAAYFEPYVMAGYTGVHSANNYKEFIYTAHPAASSVIVDVVVSPGYNQETVKAAIRQIMDDITNPLIKAEYGGGFSKTNTDILIRSSIPGVQSASFKVVVGTEEQVIPDFSLASTEIFRSINQDNLTIRTNVY